MSSWAVAILGAPVMIKKKSSIEGFKRTAELADEEQKKALNDLECATAELLLEVEKRRS